MNVLIDKFPTKVKIDGELYELNTDYRVCLKIMFAFQDDELTIQEKGMIMLRLLYKNLPINIDEAVNKAIKFLDCGKSNEESEEKSMKSKAPLFSWKKDSQYIYSAFKQSYGIDLEKEKMHWWKFVIMFMDLDENCFFNKLVGLRDRQRKGKLTKEEKEWCANHKDIIRIETPEFEAKQKLLNDFKSRLGGGENGG